MSEGLSLKQYKVEALNALNEKIMPHEGQISVGRAIFHENVHNVFLSCGRQWGKTEFAIYSICRYALENPGIDCLYVGPSQKQVEDITWKRISKMVPRNFANRVLSGRKEIHFTNGSSIYVRGSNDNDALRGVTPKFVVYEEFKDFNPDFHDDICGPVIAARNSKLVIIGTPPAYETFFTRILNEFKEEDQSDFRVFYGGTLDNPHNDKKRINREIEKLRRRGEAAKIQREYYGKFVKGGAGQVFPMFDREKFVHPHQALLTEYITKDESRFQWWAVSDPASSDTFAVLFFAIHPLTKEIFVLDEIYENDTKNTSTGKIWPVMLEKSEKLYKSGDIRDFNDWNLGHDSAAKWFANELEDTEGVYSEPAKKVGSKARTREDGVSLMKDIMYNGLLYISHKCEGLIEELEAYSIDDRGKFNENKDHAIDCFRYMLDLSHYDITEAKPPKGSTERRSRLLSMKHEIRREEDEFTNAFENWLKGT